MRGVPLPPLALSVALARRALRTRRLEDARSHLQRCARLAAVAARVEHVHGPRQIPAGPGDVILMSLVRDASFHLRDFLDHHLNRLGVRHAVLLDNGSRDDTLAIARTFPRVTVLRCLLPYRTYKDVLKEHLAWAFGMGRWVLLADADEHFVHPGFPEVSLASLVRYLQANRYTAVQGQMLDMFGEGPLDASKATMEGPLSARYPLYDLANLQEGRPEDALRASVNVYSNPEIKVVSGGIRKTIFGADCFLTKYPLFFMDGQVEPVRVDSHTVDNARVGDVSCALLHYKLVDNLRELTERAVREESYYQGSAEYKRYAAVLGQAPALGLRTPTTRTLARIDQLVEEGFLVTSPAWRSFVASLPPRAV